MKSFREGWAEWLFKLITIFALSFLGSKELKHDEFVKDHNDVLKEVVESGGREFVEEFIR